MMESPPYLVLGSTGGAAECKGHALGEFWRLEKELGGGAAFRQTDTEGGETFLYTHDKSVIIRSLANPSVADIYTQHDVRVIVAKYSPSGKYIASGDVSGKIRIWDAINKEHTLEYEFQALSGVVQNFISIKILSWKLLIISN